MNDQLERKYWYYRSLGFNHEVSLTMCNKDLEREDEEKPEIDTYPLTEIVEKVEYVEDL